MVRWALQPLQPLQKTQLQPPVGPSLDSLCHPWFTTTNLSYRFTIFETSATALCGTTGRLIYIYVCNIHKKQNILNIHIVYNVCTENRKMAIGQYRTHKKPPRSVCLHTLKKQLQNRRAYQLGKAHLHSLSANSQIYTACVYCFFAAACCVYCGLRRKLTIVRPLESNAKSQTNRVNMMNFWTTVLTGLKDLAT